MNAPQERAWVPRPKARWRAWSRTRIEADGACPMAACLHDISGLAAPEYMRALSGISALPAPRCQPRHFYIVPLVGKADWSLAVLDGRIHGVYCRAGGTPLKPARVGAEDAEFASAEAYADWRLVEFEAASLSETARAPGTTVPAIRRSAVAAPRPGTSSP